MSSVSSRGSAAGLERDQSRLNGEIFRYSRGWFARASSRIPVQFGAEACGIGSLVVSFIGSVLSTRKQRQRFYWARNVISFACAALAFHAIGGTLGLVVAVGALCGAYFTVAPVLAFLMCLVEHLYS